MNDPWEAAKTATALIAAVGLLFAGVGVLVGVLAGVVWFVVALERWVRPWQAVAIAVAVAISLTWTIVFVSTLFWGVPR